LPTPFTSLVIDGSKGADLSESYPCNILNPAALGNPNLYQGLDE